MTIRRPSQICPGCGYSLRDIPRDQDAKKTCPECGKVSTSRQLTGDSRNYANINHTGLVSALMIVSAQILIWLSWFFGDPYGWLSLTFTMLTLCVVVFVVANPIDLACRVQSRPPGFRKQVIMPAAMKCLAWNAVPICVWILTAMAWAAGVSAV